MTIFCPISYRKLMKDSKTLYVGSHLSGIRSKATGIRTKIPQYDDEFFLLFKY